MTYPTLTTALLDVDEPVRTGIYIITPKFADAVLANRNEVNRGKSPTKMEQLISDVSTGRFPLNGESIIFDSDGNLTDGQHRLTGVVVTGKPIIAVVVMGVEPETRTTVDQGIARTTGNYLQMRGYKNSTVLGSIALYLLAHSLSDGNSLGSVMYSSKQAVLNYVYSNPHLQVIATWAVSMRRTTIGICSPPHLGIARGLLEPIYGQPAVDFLERVGFGDNISKNHAAYTVRNKLANTTKPSHMMAVEVMMRGFLAHRLGHSYKQAINHGVLPKLAKIASRVRVLPPVDDSAALSFVAVA